MKLVRYSIENQTEWGVLEGERIRRLNGDVFGAFEVTQERLAVSDVKLLAPVAPSKIVAVGVNYREHAAEMREELPECPKIFLKPSTAVIGPLGSIVLPPSSQRVDHEAELAVVVRKQARCVDESEAADYILGYTCLNDVTARDLQRVDGQWTRAKSFDTFAPLGPVIDTSVTPDALDISLRVNGELRQQSNTRNLIYGPARLLSFISHIMTLLPGDVIATGTPSGVSPLRPGDVVEVCIEGIGTLINYVV